MRSVAGTPSPYIGGLIYDAVSPIATFTLSAMILAGAGTYAWLMLAKYEKPPEKGTKSEIKEVIGPTR